MVEYELAILCVPSNKRYTKSMRFYVMHKVDPMHVGWRQVEVLIAFVLSRNKSQNPTP